MTRTLVKMSSKDDDRMELKLTHVRGVALVIRKCGNGHMCEKIHL